jgi:hypothetical protein
MPLQFAEHEYKFVGLFVTRLLCDKAIEFTESPASASKITDPQLLLELRDILETQYQDGITAIREAQLNADDSFSGIFEDKVDSKLTKRFKFAITVRRAGGIANDEISYSLLNASEIANFVEERSLDFATKKASNCTKGIACGGSCISANKTCRKTADPPTKKKVAEVRKKVKGGGDTKPPDQPKTSGSGETINYKVNRSNHKELIELVRKFSEKYIVKIPEPPEVKDLVQRHEKAKQVLVERRNLGKYPTRKQTQDFLKAERELEKEKQKIIGIKNAQFEALNPHSAPRTVTAQRNGSI